MDLKFVEAGHGATPDTYGNWGKFAVGRHSAAENIEETTFPGCEGQRITSLRSNGHTDIWIFDLATGEAARFPTTLWSTPEVEAASHLAEHGIWACLLYDAFVGWLYQHIDREPTTWWQNLPRTVVLPEAPFGLYGHRRPGPAQLLRDATCANHPDTPATCVIANYLLCDTCRNHIHPTRTAAA